MNGVCSTATRIQMKQPDYTHESLMHCKEGCILRRRGGLGGIQRNARVPGGGFRYVTIGPIAAAALVWKHAVASLSVTDDGTLLNVSDGEPR